MPSPSLTHTRLKELLHYDPLTGIFTWRIYRSPVARVGDTAGTLDSHGHRQIGVQRKLYGAHRLAWFYVYGVWPKNDIDHMNRIKDDNRIKNLRDVPTALNCQNAVDARSNSKSKLLGVHRKRYSFIAQIAVGGKKIHLGSFKTAEDAHAAYIAAKQKLHPGDLPLDTADK
ncbi:HNH nuclease [uncultured Caudovirales phage]|uniref:HNH nuclease n=1 Tax=uncultured Caudovirales phage TaxID=2100421 RepID=A0A6J5TAD6_9CAUD|nr:HNH nuclease [uncultured Caudovirales phage]